MKIYFISAKPRTEVFTDIEAAKKFAAKNSAVVRVFETADEQFKNLDINVHHAYVFNSGWRKRELKTELGVRHEWLNTTEIRQLFYCPTNKLPKEGDIGTMYDPNGSKHTAPFAYNKVFNYGRFMKSLPDFIVYTEQYYDVNDPELTRLLESAMKDYVERKEKLFEDRCSRNGYKIIK